MRTIVVTEARVHPMKFPLLSFLSGSVAPESPEGAVP